MWIDLFGPESENVFTALRSRPPAVTIGVNGSDRLAGLFETHSDHPLSRETEEGRKTSSPPEGVASRISGWRQSIRHLGSANCFLELLRASLSCLGR